MKSEKKSYLTSIPESTKLRLLNKSFRDELIDERLRSYSQVYDNANRECYGKSSLNAAQQQDFPRMAKLLVTLRQQIVPYPDQYFRGRGIVLTVGSDQFMLTKVNLKMIEHSGTRLPVQLWYSSSQVSQRNMYSLVSKTSKLNVSACCFDTGECRSRNHAWQLNSTFVYKPAVTHNMWKRFPFKPAAIISATFEEVLFIDSDAYVTRDPEYLFLFDPMYLKFGALFFPDAHRSRQHSAVWELFNTTCGGHEFEFDSATILVNKRVVWTGLYMTKLMNDNHELFYKYVTDGDKDTFRLGFRHMNVKYYLVMTPCATGALDGDRFCSWTLCKTDSLAQHIFINHVHIFKYERLRYTRANLAYTRVGLGDPNNNSFFFTHCRLPGAHTSCFHIVKKPNSQIVDGCYKGGISLEDMENHKYGMNESLIFDHSSKNRILISETDNLMPHFIDNLLRYI